MQTWLETYTWRVENSVIRLFFRLPFCKCESYHTFFFFFSVDHERIDRLWLNQFTQVPVNCTPFLLAPRIQDVRSSALTLSPVPNAQLSPQCCFVNKLRSHASVTFSSWSSSLFRERMWPIPWDLEKIEYWESLFDHLTIIRDKC